jgi:hypothetical protein
MSFTVMSNIIITAAQTTKHTTWPQDNCCREPGFQFRESHAAQAGPAEYPSCTGRDPNFSDDPHGRCIPDIRLCPGKRVQRAPGVRNRQLLGG